MLNFVDNFVFFNVLSFFPKQKKESTKEKSAFYCARPPL